MITARVIADDLAQIWNTVPTNPSGTAAGYHEYNTEWLARVRKLLRESEVVLGKLDNDQLHGVVRELSKLKVGDMSAFGFLVTIGSRYQKVLETDDAMRGINLSLQSRGRVGDAPSLVDRLLWRLKLNGPDHTETVEHLLRAHQEASQIDRDGKLANALMIYRSWDKELAAAIQTPPYRETILSIASDFREACPKCATELAQRLIPHVKPNVTYPASAEPPRHPEKDRLVSITVDLDDGLARVVAEGIAATEDINAVRRFYESMTDDQLQAVTDASWYRTLHRTDEWRVDTPIDAEIGLNLRTNRLSAQMSLFEKLLDKAGHPGLRTSSKGPFGMGADILVRQSRAAIDSMFNENGFEPQGTVYASSTPQVNEAAAAIVKKLVEPEPALWGAAMRKDAIEKREFDGRYWARLFVGLTTPEDLQATLNAPKGSIPRWFAPGGILEPTMTKLRGPSGVEGAEAFYSEALPRGYPGIEPRATHLGRLWGGYWSYVETMRKTGGHLADIQAIDDNVGIAILRELPSVVGRRLLGPFLVVTEKAATAAHIQYSKREIKERSERVAIGLGTQAQALRQLFLPSNKDVGQTGFFRRRFCGGAACPAPLLTDYVARVEEQFFHEPARKAEEYGARYPLRD